MPCTDVDYRSRCVCVLCVFLLEEKTSFHTRAKPYRSPGSIPLTRASSSWYVGGAKKPDRIGIDEQRVFLSFCCSFLTFVREPPIRPSSARPSIHPDNMTDHHRHDNEKEEEEHDSSSRPLVTTAEPPPAAPAEPPAAPAPNSLESWMSFGLRIIVIYWLIQWWSRGTSSDGVRCVRVCVCACVSGERENTSWIVGAPPYPPTHSLTHTSSWSFAISSHLIPPCVGNAPAPSEPVKIVDPHTGRTALLPGVSRCVWPLGTEMVQWWWWCS